MRWLLSADLHLSDRPRDSYRFGLFKWLAKKQEVHNVDATFLLGDITDNKDKHSSSLVNKIVDELLLLKPPVYILRGNHDCIDPANPFFKFLQCVEGIDYIVDPAFYKELGVAFLPHQRTQAELEKACSFIKPDSVVMTHITVSGAQSETGMPLSGLSASPIEAKRPRVVYSGDVHKPQTVNCGALKLSYTGSPYQVRFGDDFIPRVLLLRERDDIDLHFPCLRKWSLTVTDADQLTKAGMQRGDQVKITVQLAREEVTEWATYRQRVLDVCKELGVEVYGLKLEVKTITPEREAAHQKAQSNKEVFESYCKAENVAQTIKQAGQDILDG